MGFLDKLLGRDKKKEADKPMPHTQTEPVGASPGGAAPAPGSPKPTGGSETPESPGEAH